MEIILNKDVENLGFKDDVVTVKNGYGRNFLIPQGIAVLATPSAKKNLAEVIKQRAKKEEKLVADARAIADALNKLELKIAAKVGAANKLFGSISSSDLAEAIAAQGQTIDKKFIKLPGNTIKKAGKNAAKIRLHRDVIVDFEFDVVAEQEQA